MKSAILDIPPAQQRKNHIPVVEEKHILLANLFALVVREHCSIKNKNNFANSICFCSTSEIWSLEFNCCTLGAKDGNFYILVKKTLQILFENYVLQNYVVYPSLKKTHPYGTNIYANVILCPIRIMNIWNANPQDLNTGAHKVKKNLQ